MTVTIAALGAAACGSGTPSVASVTRAQERVGISHALAVCVATAAARQLNGRDRRLLSADPGALPPDVARRVTTLAAECAVSTAPNFASPSTP